MLFLIFITFGCMTCGSQSSEQAEFIEFQQALSYLDSKKYNEAADLFSKLTDRYSENQEYRIYLADSYMGMAGFELVSFLLKIQSIVETEFPVDSHLYGKT